MDEPKVKWPEFVTNATWVPEHNEFRARFEAPLGWYTVCSVRFNGGQWEITYAGATYTAATPIGALKLFLMARSAEFSERLAATEAAIAKCVETNVLTAVDRDRHLFTLKCSCGASSNMAFHNGFMYSCDACNGPPTIKVWVWVDTRQEVVL